MNGRLPLDRLGSSMAYATLTHTVWVILKRLLGNPNSGWRFFYEGLIKHQVGDLDFEFKNALDSMNPKDSVMNSK